MQIVKKETLVDRSLNMLYREDRSTHEPKLWFVILSSMAQLIILS